jgi:hypothetical protein
VSYRSLLPVGLGMPKVFTVFRLQNGLASNIAESASPAWILTPYPAKTVNPGDQEDLIEKQLTF